MSIKRILIILSFICAYQIGYAQTIDDLKFRAKLICIADDDQLELAQSEADLSNIIKTIYCDTIHSSGFRNVIFFKVCIAYRGTIEKELLKHDIGSDSFDRLQKLSANDYAAYAKKYLYDNYAITDKTPDSVLMASLSKLNITSKEFPRRLSDCYLLAYVDQIPFFFRLDGFKHNAGLKLFRQRILEGKFLSFENMKILEHHVNTPGHVTNLPGKFNRTLVINGYDINMILH